MSWFSLIRTVVPLCPVSACETTLNTLTQYRKDYIQGVWTVWLRILCFACAFLCVHACEWVSEGWSWAQYPWWCCACDHDFSPGRKSQQKAVKLMVSGFIFFFSPACASQRMCLYAHNKPLTCTPPHICLSLLFVAFSGRDLRHTHTSASTIGRGRKSEASSSVAAKKTLGCFSPTKRAINSVSQGVTHLSGSPHGKNSSHSPPANQSQF